MTLVARRSSAWAHDIIAGAPADLVKGEVRDEAIQRYAKDIMDALAILTDPERGDSGE